MKTQDGALALRLQGVGVKRAGRWLFQGLERVLRPGAALVLVGPNGSGKTTLLRAIAGLARLDAGMIRFGDAPAILAARRFAALAGHEDALKSAETVGAFLTLCAALNERKPALVSSALSAYGLSALAGRPCGTLSAGQRRRTALAGVLASGRPIWLLDEPAGPLDGRNRARLAASVADHRARGGIVIAATHQRLDWPDAQTLSLGDALNKQAQAA